VVCILQLAGPKFQLTVKLLLGLQMSIKDLEISQQPLEVQILKVRMVEIEQKLLDGTPGIVDAMIDIHKNLQEHEELVLLLTDDDIAMLHKAHEKHKQFALVQKETKKVGKGGKKLSDNDLANL
jgi:hypothetical protein